jgi:hypothetical protein
MILPWLGPYGGYEYQRDMNTESYVPEIGIAVAPVRNISLIRIGWESTISGVAPLDRITALLWFVF